MTAKKKPEPRPWRSGHCNPANPIEIHRQCAGGYADDRPCCCTHHQEDQKMLEAAQPAPGPDAGAVPEAVMPTSGFHDGIPETDYHADRNSLSMSGAKLLLTAPALYRWRLKHPVFKTVFDFGTAAHKEVLGVGPELVVHDYDPDKVKSPKATKAWKEQQTDVRARGGVLLLPEEHQKVRQMADKLSEHTLAMRLLSDGRPEVSVYAADEETGVIRRGRLDWLSTSGILVDYKSCASADPREWAGRWGVIAKLRYDQQADWYLDLVDAAGGQADVFAFIAQEKEPPYLVSVVYVDDDDLEPARERNRQALRIYRQCVDSGVWPGYLPDGTAARLSLTDQTYHEETV